jgi:caa(3)-type oxidase subunit IV
MNMRGYAPSTLTATYATLMLLAGLSLCATLGPAGWWQTPVSMAIAVFKALGIAGIFMGLFRASPSMRWAVIAAVVMTLLLVVAVVADVWYGMIRLHG